MAHTLLNWPTDDGFPINFVHNDDLHRGVPGFPAIFVQALIVLREVKGNIFPEAFECLDGNNSDFISAFSQINFTVNPSFEPTTTAPTPQAEMNQNSPCSSPQRPVPDPTASCPTTTNVYHGTRQRTLSLHSFPSLWGTRQPPMPVYNCLRFDGAVGEWLAFKLKFIHHCRTRGLNESDWLRFLILSLSGSAEEFYVSMESDDGSLTYQQLMEALESAYGELYDQDFAEVDFRLDDSFSSGSSFSSQSTSPASCPPVAPRFLSSDPCPSPERKPKILNQNDPPQIPNLPDTTFSLDDLYCGLQNVQTEMVEHPVTDPEDHGGGEWVIDPGCSVLPKLYADQETQIVYEQSFEPILREGCHFCNPNPVDPDVAVKAQTTLHSSQTVIEQPLEALLCEQVHHDCHDCEPIMDVVNSIPLSCGPFEDNRNDCRLIHLSDEVGEQLSGAAQLYLSAAGVDVLSPVCVSVSAIDPLITLPDVLGGFDALSPHLSKAAQIYLSASSVKMSSPVSLSSSPVDKMENCPAFVKGFCNSGKPALTKVIDCKDESYHTSPHSLVKNAQWSWLTPCPYSKWAKPIDCRISSEITFPWDPGGDVSTY